MLPCFNRTRILQEPSAQTRTFASFPFCVHDFFKIHVHPRTSVVNYVRCRFRKQPLPKPTKAILAANVSGPVEGKRGETSRPASLLRRASWIWCICLP